MQAWTLQGFQKVGIKGGVVHSFPKFSLSLLLVTTAQLGNGFVTLHIWLKGLHQGMHTWLLLGRGGGDLCQCKYLQVNWLQFKWPGVTMKYYLGWNELDHKEIMRWRFWQYCHIYFKFIYNCQQSQDIYTFAVTQNSHHIAFVCRKLSFPLFTSNC